MTAAREHIREVDQAQWERLKPVLAKSRRSLRTFARAFFPNRFTRRFNSIHDEFFRLVDDDSLPRVAIAAPRGWGKTTLDSIVLPIREAIFRKRKFIVLVSCTGDVAASNVRNVAWEMLSNQRIKAVAGNLKGPVWAESSGNIITNTGVRIWARGAGQQIRGLLEGDSRPDLVIVDDLEDPEPYRLGSGKEYEAQLEDWFYADLMNSLAQTGARVILVGTVLADYSLLNQLLEDPEWASVRIELCDDNYRSHFPDYKTDEEVAALAESFARRGQLDVFYREYRNLAIAREDAVFTQDLFKHWKPEDLEGRFIDRVVIVDPAKTVKVHSDSTAIECWGFDAIRNRIYLLDLVNAKLYPEQIYEEAYQMALRHKTVNIGMEVTSLNEFITYPFNNFLRARGYPAVVELRARGRKQDRIAQLAPLYRMGAVYHHPEKRIHGPLESQLLTYPRGRHDDCIDCAAYILEMFNLGAKFFSLPEQEDEKALEEELAMLDKMDEEAGPLGDGWRVAP